MSHPLFKTVPKEEYFLPGTPACPGCPAALGLRLLLKALGPKTVLVIPASCSSIIQGAYPKTAVKVPLINIAFAASAATASGIVEALELKGVKDVNVVVWAGDGGTADIGLQGLSGAAERGHNIIYVCYDNEAYMNTGIQRSGATPYMAWTTTTPTGKREKKKEVPLIVAMHKVPYVATASLAYPHDYIMKLKKAASKKGFKYIHLLAPCPPGWRFDSSKTIEISRLAVETGMWILYEIEDGEFRLTGPSRALIDKSKRKPVELYIRAQGRFSHLTQEDITELQRIVDEEWEWLKQWFTVK